MATKKPLVSRGRGKLSAAAPRRLPALRKELLPLHPGSDCSNSLTSSHGELHEAQPTPGGRGPGAEVRDRRNGIPQREGAARTGERRPQLPPPRRELPRAVRASPQAAGGGVRPRQRQREAEAGRRRARAEAVGRGAHSEGDDAQLRGGPRRRRGDRVRRAEHRPGRRADGAGVVAGLMADTEYSHVNLLELEDQAPNLGADPNDFNIYFGRVPLNCEHCGVSYARYGPGVKAHGHRHKRQEEIYVLVGGSAQMKVGDDVIEMKKWSAVRVPPHVMR